MPASGLDRGFQHLDTWADIAYLLDRGIWSCHDYFLPGNSTNLFALRRQYYNRRLAALRSLSAMKPKQTAAELVTRTAEVSAKCVRFIESRLCHEDWSREDLIETVQAITELNRSAYDLAQSLSDVKAQKIPGQDLPDRGDIGPFF